MYRIKVSESEPKIAEWMNELEKQGYSFVSCGTYANVGYAGLVVIMHKSD